MLKNAKAPGLDGIRKKILEDVIEMYAKILFDIFNTCGKTEEFFREGKSQKLSLMRKGDKYLDKTSLYMPISLWPQ